MTTTKSYSKNRIFALYTPALKSRLSFAITTFILMSLIIVMPYSLDTPNLLHLREIGAAQQKMSEYLISHFHGGVIAETGWQVLATLVLGIVSFASALNANSYLHTKSRTDFYHSLPVTRLQLLISNMAASVTAVVVPYLVVHFFVMAMQLVTFGQYGCFGTDYYIQTFTQLLGNLLYILVVYIFTTFICVQVGTVFDSLAVSGIIGFIPMTLYGVCGFIWQNFTYGAEFDGRLILLLSPFTFVFDRYAFYRNGYTAGFWWSLAAWLVVGALLFAGAILLYRRRPSEIAGQTQSQGVLQTVVKAFTAFCGAMFFYGVMYDSNALSRAVSMVVGGIAIGIIAEIILSRGLKNTLRNLKWLALGSVLAVLLQVGAAVDIIGYENRLPRESSVVGVDVDYVGRYADMTDYRHYSNRAAHHGGMEAHDQVWGNGFYTEESIREVMEAHRAAINNKPDGEYDPSYLYKYVNITYHLASGGTMTRSYDQIYYEAFELLADLEDNEDFIRYNNPLYWAQDSSAGGNEWQVREINLIGAYQIGDPIKLQRLPEEEKSLLLDALRGDLLAEDAEEIKHSSTPTAAHIEVVYNNDTLISIPVSQEYKATMAVLEDLNLLARLESPDRQPDKLYIIPPGHSYVYQEQHRVSVAAYFSGSAEKSPSRIEYPDFQMTDMIAVTDLARMELINKVARSQLFQQGEENRIVTIVAEKNGEACGWQMAYIADLPDFIQEGGAGEPYLKIIS